MRQRSNLLVLLGLVSFVLGLLAVYLITGDDDDDGGGGDPDNVQVIVAAADIEAGTSGEDVLRDEAYRVQEVPLAQKQADALVTASELSGRVFAATVVEGDQIRASALLGSASTAIRAPIPEGFEAVSVSVPFVAGGANTVIAGDRVNVFLVVPGTLSSTEVNEEGEAAQVPPPFRSPRAELLLTNSLVLAVQTGPSPLQVAQAQPGQTSTQASTGALTVQLALDTIDVEKVIFATTAEGSQLYLSRVRLDDEGNPPPPVAATGGIDFGTILAEEAGAAFQRSDG